MTRISRTALVGRSAEASTLQQALRQQGVAGAVVVGAAGIGKTAFLQSAQQTHPSMYFVRVRGALSAAATPYRALGFLLAEVPAERAHAALLPAAIAACLQDKAAGRPVVFAVDNADLLDAASATLIGQLVASGTARLVLAVEDFARLDPVFSAMWRGGLLSRLELAELSMTHTRQILESELGAPISHEGLDAVWAVAQGNPRGSLEALRALVEQSALVRRGPAWVLVRGARDSQVSTLQVRTALASLTPSERSALGLLALAGPSRWSLLTRLHGASDLDALESRGLVAVQGHPEPVLSVSDSVMARELVQSMRAEEAAALLTRYTAVPGAARHLEADPVRAADWKVRAGAAVGEAQLVEALSILNNQGEYSRAAELVRLSRVDGCLPGAPVALQAVVAALAQAQHRTAELFGTVLAQVNEQADLRLWVECRVQLARIRRRKSAAGAAALLEGASRRIVLLRETAAPASRPELTQLHRLICAAQAEASAFDGRYRENLTVVPGLLRGDLPASVSREERELEVTLQSLLLEAQALAGGRSASAEVLQTFSGSVCHPEVSHGVADAAVQRVALAEMLAGGWVGSSGVLGKMRLPAGRWSMLSGSLAELVDSLALMGQDRVRDAVRMLGPVVEQLRVADPQGFLPVAAAALTYCHSQLNAREEMIAHLPLAESGTGSPWSVRRGARHFQLMSATHAESRDEAAQRLQDQAAEDVERGAESWALLALAAAVRMGRRGALDELHTVAGTVQGPMALVCRLYSQALLEADRELLVEAMARAVRAGAYRFATDMAQDGIAAAASIQDKADVRFFQRKLRQFLPDGLERLDSGATFDALTSREREIAVLAAVGRSNRDIAETLFVSVRTVEGHLYQVYSKLNVGTRAELANCVPVEAVP